MLARKDSTGAVIKPKEHVVVETQMESANHLEEPLLLLLCEEGLPNELGDHLKEFVQVH